MTDRTYLEAPRGGTVLIVDDVESAALEISIAGIEGVSVKAVSSAAGAVRAIRSDEFAVSAIVTDVHMPGMDGLQLIQHVRADGRYARIPIIVLTADTAPDMPDKALQLGADAFFTKPCSPAAVRKTLEDLLNVKRES